MPITVTANTGQTKVYGAVDPVFSYGYAPSLIGSDAFTGSLSRNPGQTVLGGPYAITQGTLALSSNYTLNYTGANFTITPKSVTPSITANDKCADGTTTATLSSQTLSGVISPDVVTLIVGSSNFATAAAGIQTVTASSLTLGGADAGNYSLSSVTATDNAEIYAIPAPVISGDITACPNSQITYSTPLVGSNTYQWSVTGGVINSNNNNSINVVWNNNITTATVQLTESNSHCSIYTTLTVSIAVPAPVISGNLTVVTVADEVYSTPSTINHLYSWTVIGGSITSGQGTNSIHVNWTGSAATRSVSVTETSAAPYGCSATATENVTVPVVGKSISGYVNYDNLAFYGSLTPMNDVTVTIKNAVGAVVATTTTAPNFNLNGESGYYEFTNIPVGSDYTITASYNGVWGGNNATDALIVQKSTIGTYTLSAIQFLSADVNASNSISSLDALYIKLRTVGTITSYPAGNWKFETISITNLSANLIDQNLLGLCSGDVNGSYIIGSAKSSTDIVDLSDHTIQVQKGKSFNYDIKAASLTKIGAMTLVMNYDEKLFEVENLTSALAEMKYTVDNGKISIAWADVNGSSFKNEDVIISLQLKAKQSFENAMEIFSITNESEFADINAKRIDNFSLKLSNVISSDKVNGISVSNYPNPFRKTTNITYVISEKSTVKITISNYEGHAIAIISQGVKDAGSYQEVIDADELKLTSGIYLYTVEVNGLSGSFVKTNKLVLEK
jgi:hypothetical protein